MNDPTNDSPWPLETSPFAGYDHDLDFNLETSSTSLTKRVNDLETIVAQLSDDLAHIIDTLQRHESILENLEASVRELINERNKDE